MWEEVFFLAVVWLAGWLFLWRGGMREMGRTSVSICWLWIASARSGRGQVAKCRSTGREQGASWLGWLVMELVGEQGYRFRGGWILSVLCRHFALVARESQAVYFGRMVLAEEGILPCFLLLWVVREGTFSALVGCLIFSSMRPCAMREHFLAVFGVKRPFFPRF